MWNLQEMDQQQIMACSICCLLIVNQTKSYQDADAA